MMHQSVARFHSPGRRLARLAGLLALAALGPACYSSSGHNYMAPGGPAGAGVLFSDGFVMAPGTPLSSDAQWSETPAPSNATLTVTYSPPDYYVRLAETSRPASASAISGTMFTSEALTFTVGIRYSTSGSSDLGVLQIVDATTTGTVYASATLDATANSIALKVGGNPATTVTGLSAGVFYTVTFTIDASNMASWHILSTTTTPEAFGAHSTRLQLASSWPSAAGTAAAFDFTAASVSSP